MAIFGRHQDPKPTSGAGEGGGACYCQVVRYPNRPLVESDHPFAIVHRLQVAQEYTAKKCGKHCGWQGWHSSGLCWAVPQRLELSRTLVLPSNYFPGVQNRKPPTVQDKKKSMTRISLSGASTAYRQIDLRLPANGSVTRIIPDTEFYQYAKFKAVRSYSKAESPKIFILAVQTLLILCRIFTR